MYFLASLEIRLVIAHQLHVLSVGGSTVKTAAGIMNVSVDNVCVQLCGDEASCRRAGGVYTTRTGSVRHTTKSHHTTTG